MPKHTCQDLHGPAVAEDLSEWAFEQERRPVSAQVLPEVPHVGRTVALKSW